MKRSLFLLVTVIVITLKTFAQSAGDYRSIGNGNWNDATKWETYNDSEWVNATTYPGQNSGTGAVTIMNETQITITISVPYPITYLIIDADIAGVLSSGVLAFSSANAVSLKSESVVVYGELRVENQNGANSHTLFVGSGFVVGRKLYDPESYCPPYGFIPATFQTINQDDILSVVFNSTAYNWIDSGPDGITFQDIIFNNAGSTIFTPVYIRGAATFISGIVTTISDAGPVHNADCDYTYANNGSIFFYDDATVSGAANSSYVDGPVTKFGDDPFTFPIGDENAYAPLTISAPTTLGAAVSAQYVRSNASDLGPISDAGLFNVSNCEYWSLGGLDNNYALDITVGWSAASGCGYSLYVANPSEVTLAHFNFTTWQWDSHGGSGVGTATNGSVTWNGVTTSGPFTLGNLSSVCNAPWGSATNIFSNSATLNWTAISGAVSYDVDYKPYTSSEWLNAATGTTSTSVNLLGLIPWMYYDWRIRTNCSLSSSSYRQAQFQTLCGPPSGLTTTNITANSASLSWSAVSGWVSYNVEYKQSTSGTWITAATSITSPSFTLGGLTAGTAYDWRVLVNCTIDNQGGYTQSSFTTLPNTTPPCYDIYEPNNSSSQATTINLGNTISALISSSTDVDWFKMVFSGNTNIVLNIFLSNSPADYDLYVYNKNLVLLGSSTTNSNETVTFNVHGKNTIYIKVVGKNGTYNSSQCYNLIAYIFSNNARVLSITSDRVNEIAEASNKITLYPNPASEFVHLQFNSLTNMKTNAQIFNSVGQLVKFYPVNIIKGNNEARIQLDDMKPGIYILSLRIGELNLLKKFVIER